MAENEKYPNSIFSVSLKSGHKITNVGLRVMVTSFLIDNGRFERGKVENITENEVKIFVEGTENDVKDMLPRLRTMLEKLSDDDNLLIPKPIEIGEPQIIGMNPHPMQLPKLTDFAQSLMLEQTGKGVCVMSNGFKIMSDGFNSLGKKFDSVAGLLERHLEKYKRELSQNIQAYCWDLPWASSWTLQTFINPCHKS